MADIKKLIKDTEMSSNSNAEDISKIMKTMAKHMEEQSSPMLGIFWYDPVRKELFGINSAFADELSYDSYGRKTTKMNHKTYWADQHRKVNRTHSSSIDKMFYFDDYTQFPRGRIAQYKEDGSFHLMCGDWIDEYPEVVDLVKEEFNLTDVDLIVTKAEHWEIGHGWSGDWQ